MTAGIVSCRAMYCSIASCNIRVFNFHFWRRVSCTSRLLIVKLSPLQTCIIPALQNQSSKVRFEAGVALLDISRECVHIFGKSNEHRWRVAGAGALLQLLERRY